MSLPWPLFRGAVSGDDKPTPFHVHRELVFTMENGVHLTREAAEFFIDHLSDQHPHVRLKSLLCLRQISAKVAPFRQYLRSNQARIPGNELLALGCSPEASQLLLNARKNLTELLASDDASLEAQNALLNSRCEGFGTRAPSFSPSDHSTSLAPVDFLVETVQEVAEDFRTKGALATIKDATVDVADLLAEGLEGLAGLMRKVLPSNNNTAAPVAPRGSSFAEYRQHRGDQFAALFEASEAERSTPDLLLDKDPSLLD
jgi:hypothetical protein